MDMPFAYDLVRSRMIPTRFNNHVVRNLTALKGQFSDERAHVACIARDDAPVYEVYEVRRPESAGELLHGVSIVHPGNRTHAPKKTIAMCGSLGRAHLYSNLTAMTVERADAVDEISVLIPKCRAL